VWHERRSVEACDVDTVGRLRPHALLAYLLNAAWNHARDSSYGYEELAARDRMWVLSRIRLGIRRLPAWNDGIAISTWGKRADRLFALRDFVVASEAGETVATAASAWLILNRKTGHPLRFDREPDDFPWQPLGRDEAGAPDEVPALAGGAVLARFPVLFSDVDVNRHVNSTSYLRWILDTHPFGFLEANEPARLELCYLSPAMPEDEVVVVSDRTEQGELCAVRRASDGRDLCRARIVWRVS
jgi:medium-chain acyl-[acyl-carrier-protein] hydrolase